MNIRDADSRQTEDSRQQREDSRQQIKAPMSNDAFIRLMFWDSYRFLKPGTIKDSFRVGL